MPVTHTHHPLSPSSFLYHPCLPVTKSPSHFLVLFDVAFYFVIHLI